MKASDGRKAAQQLHQARLTESVSLTDPRTQAALDNIKSVMPTDDNGALGVLYGRVQQAAATLSFLDCFWLLGIACLIALPLVLLMKRSQSGAAARVRIDVGESIFAPIYSWRNLAMRISKYIHSCLLVELGPDKILFDPGKFSFVEGLVKPEQFQNLSAIILTHQHPDHVDDAALKQILKHNASAIVITNTEIQARLAKEGISAEVLEAGTHTIGHTTIRALAAEHAQILNAAPPQNIAYIVDDTLLHPGDSFDQSLNVCKGIQMLALPIMAPWTTELQVAAFARRIAPQQIIPIHDGYAKDFFREQRYENFQKYFSPLGVEFLQLSQPGDAVEI